MKNKKNIKKFKERIEKNISIIRKLLRRKSRWICFNEVIEKSCDYSITHLGAVLGSQIIQSMEIAYKDRFFDFIVKNNQSEN